MKDLAVIAGLPDFWRIGLVSPSYCRQSLLSRGTSTPTVVHDNKFLSAAAAVDMQQLVVV